MSHAKVIPLEPRRRLRESVAPNWALITLSLGYVVALCWFGWWLA